MIPPPPKGRAVEPITLFARTADPAAVAHLLRGHPTAGVDLDGPDDSWGRATLTFDGESGPRSITFTHDPGYYAGPDWPRQMDGMRGYFARFPESPARERVMMLTTTFRFALGTLFDPDFDPEGDPRLEVLARVAELLDGVLFSPSGLRDPSGRVLLDADGESDPDAVWPRVRLEAPSGEVEPMLDALKGEPPTPERVARRALALVAVTARAVIERDAADPGMAELVDELRDWARDLDLDGELEPAERELLAAPLGSLAPQDLANAGWRLEGLAVLAWALNRFELPPHDQLVEMNPLWQSLGMLDADAARELLSAPDLRPRAELQRLRARLLTLHWRVRDFWVNPVPMDFAAFVARATWGPLDLTGLPLEGGDLALGGARLDSAPPGLMQAVRSATRERHLAINWLCDGPADYSEASVAT